MHRRRVTECALAVAALLVLWGPQALAIVQDPLLAAGIEQIKAARDKEAIATLSSFVSQAGGDASRQIEVAEAYLYLGIAYARLGQRSPALTQFTRALRRNPEAALDPSAAPQVALDLFAQAKGKLSALPRAGGSTRSKVPLVLVGVAAAGSVAVVAAGGGGGSWGSTTSPTPPPPPTFVLITASGPTVLTLLQATPVSGSIVRPGVLAPVVVFRYVVPDSVPRETRVVVELLGAPGPCWQTTSMVLRHPPGTEVTLGMTFSAQAPTCTTPFTTVALQARLVDVETARPILTASYSGGYTVNP